MKKISVLVPTYNEEGNVEPMAAAIDNLFQNELKNYCYELVFIDNNSKDTTRVRLREICKKNKNVKAIFNANNFGWMRSPIYGLQQTTGDCTVLLCADFQEPVEMIPKFVKEWENGYKIVVGIKNNSKESKFFYFLRSCYYKLIGKFATVEQIEHFTGFGLYDKDFIQVLRDLHDPMPYIKGIVAELGYKRKEIEYTQQERKSGKSKGSFWNLYDTAMLGITSYTKVFLRLATIFGFIFSALSFTGAIVFLILKLTMWYRFPMGIAPILISIFLIGAVQTFFVGLLGEYILNINTRIMDRPLVIEEERLNFNTGDDSDTEINGNLIQDSNQKNDTEE